MFEGLHKKVKNFKEKVSSTEVSKRIKERSLDDALDRLLMELVESDVAFDVAEEITKKMKKDLQGEVGVIEGPGKAVDKSVNEALRKILEIDYIPLDKLVREGEWPVHILFVGPNGAGKTTTIAKFAYRYRDLEPVFASGDTFRAGASEQLGEYANDFGVKMISHQRGADPAAVVYDAVEHAKASGKDLILSDTAGRLHNKKDLMNQLKKIKRVTEPDIVLFVDEAVAGNDAARRSKEFDEAVEIDGSILTKVDADTRGGAILSVIHATGKPVFFIGTGQQLEDLKPFDVDWYIEEVTGNGS